MLYTILIAVGVLIGLIIGYFAWGKSKPSAATENLAEKSAREHAAEIARAIAYLKGKTEITNNELEHFLKVSDTTTGRYLDELESKGLLKQIGKTGEAVKYQVL